MFHAKEDIVSYFEKGIFPFKGNVFKTKEKEKDEMKEKTKEEKTEEFINDAIALIKSQKT